MSNLIKEYGNPLSSFELIKDEYENIEWETITSTDLEEMLEKINVPFSTDDDEGENEKERIEYLKELLEAEKSKSLITPSLQSKKLIAKIEALKKTYSKIAKREIEPVDELMEKMIAKLEQDLEEERIRQINELAEAEREAAMQEELNALSEEESINQELNENDSVDSNASDSDDIDTPPPPDDDDDESDYDDDESDYDDEEDGETAGDENSKKSDVVPSADDKNSSTTKTLKDRGNNSKSPHNKKYLKNLDNTLNKEKNNDGQEEVSAEDNYALYDKLMQRIDDLEEIINTGKNKNDNSSLDNNSVHDEFGLNNQDFDFANQNKVIDEFNNKGIEFDNLSNGEMDFFNNKKDFDFTANNNEKMFNNNGASNFDLTRQNNELQNQEKLINELTQRISSLENRKDLEKENSQLRKEIHFIKKNISKLAKRKAREKYKYRGDSEKPTKITSDVNNSPVSPQQLKESKIENNIKNIIKNTNLSNNEKNKLKNEILSNVKKEQSVIDSNKFKKENKTVLSAKEMETIILELSKRMNLDKINEYGDNQFRINQPSSDLFKNSQSADPFENINNQQSDPFLNLENNNQQSDPFANLGNDQQSDPFANINNQQSDPFANLGNLNQQSDPFTNLGNNNQQSDPFANINSSQQDPFANINNSQQDPFANFGKTQSDPFDKTAKKNVDIQELQKQIKQLQKIVLGKEGKKEKFSKHNPVKKVEPLSSVPNTKKWVFNSSEIDKSKSDSEKANRSEIKKTGKRKINFLGRKQINQGRKKEDKNKELDSQNKEIKEKASSSNRWVFKDQDNNPKIEIDVKTNAKKWFNSWGRKRKRLKKENREKEVPETKSEELTDNNNNNTEINSQEMKGGDK